MMQHTLTMPASGRSSESELHVPFEALAAVARLRSEAEAEIERLITLLDQLDGDADFEMGDDEADDSDLEPMLGWTAEGRLGATYSAHTDECEATDCDNPADLDGMIEQCPGVWGGYGWTILDDGDPDDFEAGRRATVGRR